MQSVGVIRKPQDDNSLSTNGNRDLSDGVDGSVKIN